MSNHLRDLLDAVGDGEPVFFEHMTDRQMAHVETNVLKAGEQAVCFYGGDVDDLANFKVIEDLVRLPFDVCWVEVAAMGQGAQVVFGGMLWLVDGRINGQAWRKFKGEWRYLFSWERTEDCKSLVAHTHPDMNQRSIQAQICYLHLFLTAMNCTNITKREHSTPEKLQKARVKRGKKPLFSYWTLEIDLPKRTTEQTGAGGTHAAPRLHLCRGHMKKRKTGYFWWQPHVRGDKKSGMVQKDYAASYQQTEASNA